MSGHRPYPADEDGPFYGTSCDPAFTSIPHGDRCASPQCECYCHAPRRQEAKCRHCHRDIIRLSYLNWFHKGGREDCGLVAQPAPEAPTVLGAAT